ncbi:hypothetical protein [Flaviaesturariibacter amylovorans]|uniref:Uncharacterized protein n=1 Tax=Flaviaesturariibacter amylovorans TaxID=1084520 RepID=A0ABP8HMS6_9BACT
MHLLRSALALLLLASCADTEKKSPAPEAAQAPPADSIRHFTPDNYPVTNGMLDDTSSNNSSYPRRSGALHSSDKAWFANDSLGQALVFELYTDKHRLATYHFYSTDMPEGLLRSLELHNADNDLAPLPEKRASLPGFIKGALRIGAEYFVSDKGFRLGDDKQKFIKVYDTPDSIAREGALDVLHWRFEGDALYDGKTELRGRPLAKDSYGHQVTAYFRNDKLVGLLLYNDIP